MNSILANNIKKAQPSHKVLKTPDAKNKYCLGLSSGGVTFDRGDMSYCNVTRCVNFVPRSLVRELSRHPRSSFSHDDLQKVIHQARHAQLRNVVAFVDAKLQGTSDLDASGRRPN